MRKHYRPVQSREAYTLAAIERAWPSGEWIDEALCEPPQEEGEGVPGDDALRGHEAAPSPPTLTIIGGTKYDKDRLRRHILGTPGEVKLLTGSGRGAEIQVYDLAESLARPYGCIPADPDRYGKSARKVNVEQVLCFAPDSPLLLVGSGERVKQAKEWLKRTMSKRPVTELS